MTTERIAHSEGEIIVCDTPGCPGRFRFESEAGWPADAATAAAAAGWRLHPGVRGRGAAECPACVAGRPGRDSRGGR
jgi:hypothetical protein